MLGADLELAEGRGEGEGVAGEAGAGGVGLVLAGAAHGELDEGGRDGAEQHDHDHADDPGALVVVGAADGDEPSEVDKEHHHRGQRARHRRDQDVAVVDVAELVADDAAQLALVEQAQNPVRAADGGIARVAPGGEGVRRLRGRDVQPGHRLTRGRRELADHAIELRCLEFADGPGPHRAQGELVAVPVGVGIGAESHQDRDDQARAAEDAADGDDERGQPSEEHCCPEPVVPAVHGTPSKWCGRGTLEPVEPFELVNARRGPPVPFRPLLRSAWGIGRSGDGCSFS